MVRLFNFIFDYNDYIDNILNENLEDDLDMYNKFKDQIIVEGLLKTHPREISISIIEKRFPYLKCKLEKDGDIYLEGDFTELKNHIPLFNNLGYFISILTFDGSNWIKEYTDESKPIALFLEPKYDVKINTIPNFLYHSTIKKFNNRIEKIGLIPRSMNKLTNHPDRIYLTDNIEIAKSFGMNLKNKYNEDFSIYKINTIGLDINLYEDINLKNGGYYTLNNISPKFLERII